MTDPISVNYHWRMPGIYHNDVMGYFASKVSNPQYRLIAVGEEHGAGGHNNIRPRCIRRFIADALVHLNARDSSGAYRSHRPRALGLELDEDECRTPYSSFRAPATISVRVRNRGIFSTQQLPVVNRRALWLATQNAEANEHFRELLLTLAIGVPDNQLLVRGIDGDGNRRDLISPSMRMTRHDGSPLQSTDRGIVRDYIMLQRLNQLITDMAALDADARAHGKVVILLGANHVDKISPWINYPQLGISYRDYEDGTYYTMGHFAGAGAIRSNSGEVEVSAERYCALRCLFEGMSFGQRLLDLNNYRFPIAADYVQERGAVVVPSGTVSYPELYTYDYRHAVVFGPTRAYDLLSGVYFSFNAGVDIEDFERSLLRTHPLTPPRVRINIGFSNTANLLPMKDAFDGFLYFRWVGSWSPLVDPFCALESTPETRGAPSIYWVPGIDTDPLSTWESRWASVEPHLAVERSLYGPGVFGDRQFENRSPGELVFRHTYARFDYRRVSFAFVPRASITSGLRVMLVGYGFLPRRGETLDLQVEVGYGLGSRMSGTNVRALSDALALFTMPTNSGQTPESILVRFPGIYENGERMQATLYNAFGTGS